MRGWEVAREEGVATRDGRDGWTSESDVTRLPVGLCMANATEDNKGMHYQNSDENGEGVKITHNINSHLDEISYFGPSFQRTSY